MVYQAKPGAVRDLLPVYVEQLVKIVTQAQADPDLPRRFVAFEDKAGEQRSRAVLDGQCVGQPEIVVGNDIRIDQSHRMLPAEDCRSVVKGLLV